MTGSRRTICRLAALAIAAGAPAYSQPFFSHAVIGLPEVRVNAPWVEVLETQEEWTSFYVSHFGSDTASVAVPEIDFDKYRVVAGGLGYQAAGGPRIAIERVVDAGNLVYVSGAIVRPDSDCLVTQMVNWPTTAIVIPQSDKPVRMAMVSAVYVCE